MTGLTLKVVSVDAVAPPQAFARAFDSNGGTIGRDDSNSMALPDKHRRVSRLHATISFPGGVATVTNSSTSLPISVADQQLDSGESAPIANGTLIEIGPYILQASFAGAAHIASDVAVPPANTLRPEHAVASAISWPSAPVAVPPPQLAASDVDVGALFAPPSPAAHQAQPAPLPTNDPLLALIGGAPGPAARGSMSGSGVAQSPLPSPASPAAFVFPPTPAPMPVFPAPSVPQQVAPPTSYSSPAAAPFASLIPAAPEPGPSAGGDPFANLLVGIGSPSASSQAMPAIGHVPAGLVADPLAALGGSLSTTGYSSPPVASSGANISGALIPDDFNPFAMPSETSRNAADPLSGLLGTAPGQPDGAAAASGPAVAPPIDSLFQNGSGFDRVGDSLHAPLSQARDGNSDLSALLGPADGNSDPLALFDSPAAAPTHRPMRDDSLELGAAFAPPLPLHADPLAAFQQAAPTPVVVDPFAGLMASPVAQPAAVSVVPGSNTVAASPLPAMAPVPAAPSARPVAAFEPVAAPQRPTASPDALTEAFLRGAGLPPSALPQGLTPEVMMMVGSVLRSATAGAVDMLAARAATKREVQASVTIISVQANNPLKFLPNADAAMLQLLGKKMPGFMRADVAMRDAFDDLRAHEVGVIAGTRAALTEVLGKFDPAVLGEKLAKGSVLESVMPSARKAKLWDMYLERYLQIRREAEDDFQSIFGRAFVQAYERETARIKGEVPASGGDR